VSRTLAVNWQVDVPTARQAQEEAEEAEAHQEQQRPRSVFRQLCGTAAPAVGSQHLHTDARGVVCTSDLYVGHPAAAGCRGRARLRGSRCSAARLLRS